MSLVADESVYVTEGIVQEICVMVYDKVNARERDVHLSFSVLSRSNTNGRLVCIIK